MGLELELPSAQLSPIRTVAAAAQPEYGSGVDDVAVDAVVLHDEGACSTPKSVDSMLLTPAMCPPAPRKPRPRPVAAPAPAPTRWRKKRHARCYDCGRRPSSFFVSLPHDLAEVFVSRRPTASTPPPCRPPDGKKIRVHVVHALPLHLT
ncbi:hypothetical protein GUJ93_ZPchr0002g24171 [Zizania palustris]|uniref:Uncharacterized protein n=1 Tax=Zizania palustris TaxID=103762 RepID=A0A8J5RWV8_ZIZPA|nr:hypothetical protein GUJ93_ZPchr0002g24171 [Zizania palustris]